MVLPGFHQCRSIQVHIHNDEKCLWHYFDDADVKVPIPVRGLTGKLEYLYLRKSTHEKAANKLGVEGLKGFLVVGCKSDGCYYKYTITAGLDSVFFRTLFIAIAAIPENQLGHLLTIEPWLSKEGILNASILNPLNQAKFSGIRYGKEWAGLDYPALIASTLAKFKGSEESFNLLGMGDPRVVQSIEVPPLYPEHNAQVKKARLAAGFDPSWAKEYFDITYSGLMPSQLPPQNIADAIRQWATLCDYAKHNFATEDQAQSSFETAIAIAVETGQSDIADIADIFVEWIGGWTPQHKLI